MPRILAIETSCDETAAAVVEGDTVDAIRVLINTIASQAALHAKYGGVFPDLAAREHTKRIVPVLGLALHEAGLLDDPNAQGEHVRKALESIDAIAVTVGPGLIGPLLIGTAAAAQLTNLTGKPVIPVNHWEGHIYSAFLPNAELAKSEELRVKSRDASLFTPHPSPPRFPILALTVSGGHTSLILMTDHFQYQMLGSTVDDAAGEAFDKCARLLGLPYPGGPALSRAAAQVRNVSPLTSDFSLRLPRPMLTSGDLRFSFSGLKTAVRYAIDRGDIDPSRRDLLGGGSRDSSEVEESARPLCVPEAAREIEDAIVDVLLAKLQQAIEQTRPASVAIVGGVSANKELRRRFLELTIHYPLATYHLPEGQYTTDNAAMIGAAGLVRFLKQTGVGTWRDLHANASLRLS